MSAADSASEKALWAAYLLTLFPEMFPGPLGHSLAGRGLKKGIWSLDCHDIRSFASEKHANVDAPPFGGGHGMVMRPDVMGRAIEHVIAKQPPKGNLTRLYPSPRGKLLDQKMARKLSQEKEVMIVCGRYEGLDQRVIDHYQLTEISIGDYVLSGGEQAAMVILDAVVRLLPGVMGKEASHLEDSFENGLLEHHHYTQPRDWQGIEPPEVLLSGHHQNIAKWRHENAIEITADRRPDLLAAYMAKKQPKKADKD
jgi:tRNA (guanine37-N1)-methyltransferase